MTTATELPQHLRSLALANEVRMKRCALKRAIAAGRRTAPSVLADIPDYAETMPVGELLRAQERWGRKRAHRLCVGLAISELRPLRALTDRQRGLLIAELGRG